MIILGVGNSKYVWGNENGNIGWENSKTNNIN
jgi:hypothetical protein